ncbi:endonuclease/exonuclease/phosphatase family protein [Parendozoicomonas sp. Alg238-R29]|uniref:endonuclease/exonuclease/phosphatase family protein n=1 Tax=Parendozoicomonas sp. Alg238-R29 TaxID=2993446 RepID=UPI00248EE79D|nr:endonuclease/exonuclease/phosphatase family protein [Parendozoicomonas sp. Alg238-R29]
MKPFHLFILLFCAPLFASQEFNEFPWQGFADTSVRLCPEASHSAATLEDKINISCSLEGENQTRFPAQPKNELKVVEWNIERGYKRHKIAAWLEAQQPDIVLLSEVDRGCARTGYRQIAQYLASELGMYYVYGVEFVEVDDFCEHGNAILSRYPMGNVELIRFKSASSRYVFNRDDELRVGGRMALSADVLIGEQTLRVYSTHLASHFKDAGHRHDQTEEIAEHLKSVKTPIVVGGDMNTHTFFIEARLGLKSTYVLKPLYKAGLKDAHKGLSASKRTTHPGKPNTIIDFIFYKRATLTSASVCSEDSCRRLSDHLPIQATIKLKK